AFDQHVAVGDMGLRERLRHGVDGTRGNASLHQFAAKSLRFEAGKRTLQLRAKRCDVTEPIGVGPKARIIQQVAASHLLAEAAKLAVIEDAEKYFAVGRRELVVGRDV